MFVSFQASPAHLRVSAVVSTITTSMGPRRSRCQSREQGLMSINRHQPKFINFKALMSSLQSSLSSSLEEFRVHRKPQVAWTCQASQYTPPKSMQTQFWAAVLFTQMFNILAIDRISSSTITALLQSHQGSIIFIAGGPPCFHVSLLNAQAKGAMGP